jgi:small-conductance mechanosensitive channel/CRP-like cAMP-binding protein
LRPQFTRLLAPAASAVGSVGVALAFHKIVPSWLDPRVATAGLHLVDVVAAFALAWLCSRVLEAFVWRVVFRRHDGGPPPRLVTDLLAFAVYLVAAGVLLVFVFHQPIEGLLATSGVVGIVFGLALKNMISDVFSGLALNVEQPYRVGDWIQYEGDVGKVVEINWRATRIQRKDRVTIVVPNGVLAGARVYNYSLAAPYGSRLEICLEHSLSPDRALRILGAAAKSTRSILAEPAASTCIVRFEPHGVVYAIDFYVDDFVRQTSMRHDLQRNVMLHLYQAGVSLARPKSDVVVGATHESSALDLEALLRRVPLFDALDAGEIATLACSMQRREIKVGHVLTRRGEPGSSLFVVVEGVLDVLVEIEGVERKVAPMSPGSFFGEMSMLTGEPRSATVVASTDALVYEIERDDLAPLLDRRPAIASLLSDFMAERRLAQESLRASAQPGAIDVEKKTLASQFLGKILGLFGRGRAA